MRLYSENRSDRIPERGILNKHTKLSRGGMDRAKKLAPPVATQLRRLAHDLSNSIETVMQASYLLAQTRLDANGKKWNQMIETAAQDAARVNRGIREILRNQNDKPVQRRRAS
jgi:hypothetical protein